MKLTLSIYGKNAGVLIHLLDLEPSEPVDVPCTARFIRHVVEGVSVIEAEFTSKESL